MEINYSNLTKANVYLRKTLAGQLEKVHSKKYIFEYNLDYVKNNGVSIGLSLDIRKIRYESPFLDPFFENLIPEGWLFRTAEKYHKIDKDNKFAILLATGRETIGAIRIVPLDESGDEIEFHSQFKEQGSGKGPGEEEEDQQEELFDLNPPSQTGICSYCLNPLNKNLQSQHPSHPKCVKNLWETSRKLKIGLNSDDPLESFRKTIDGASISGAQRKGLCELLAPKGASF